MTTMKIPYGYVQNDNQEVRVNPSHAETVKLIYDLYLQGKSLGGIAQYLQEYHITSPAGNDIWARAAIDNILSNRKYVSAIIPLEQFVETQFEKDKRSNVQLNNKRKTARYNSQNVLSGLLICGDCGKNYRCITRSSGEIVWRCSDKVENGKHSACNNLNTVTDAEIKHLICLECDLSEFDEQKVKDTVERIIVFENRIDIQMKQQQTFEKLSL
jgi:hypothetical protein